MQLRQLDLIFKVLRHHDPAILPGMAIALSSETALIAESSNDDAVVLVRL